MRGLNARSLRDTLHTVVNDAPASIVYVQETKLHVISPFLVTEMLGNMFSSYAYLSVERRTIPGLRHGPHS